MKTNIPFQPIVATARPFRRWMMPLGGVLLLAIGGGAWITLHANNIGAAADSKSQSKKIEVFELSSGDFAQVEARELRVSLPVSGTLNALSQATVRAKVAGEVLATPAAEGVKVLRGQVVVRLDTADLKARLATQQAAHEEAGAKLALARKNHATNLTLLKQKFISQNAFDTAHNSVELAQAGVKSTASQLDMARRALDDSLVRAPIDGVISKRFVQPGEKAAPDMPLFAIVNLAQLILEAQVPASEIPRVRAGQEVVFNVDGFQGRDFVGKVARINPTAEAGTRAMTVYITVDNADGALMAGMFAKGGVTLEKSPVLPLLPLVALRRDDGATIVYKIENNTIVAQPVKLGLRNDGEGVAAAAAGLTAGDRVLVVKLDGVKPGSAVKLPQPGQDMTPAKTPDAS